MALKGLGELPVKGAGLNDHMSWMWPLWFEAMNAAVRGVDCVLSGCAITGGADMTPAVAKGAVLTNGVLKPVTAADVTIGAADATNPRWDLIVVNSSGTKAVRAGTAAANPAPPALTANDVLIGAVYVPANDTAIGSDNLIDLRFIRDGGPITIAKSTTNQATNTSSGEIKHISVTIPNGLFVSGRILRLRAWGDFLLNFGTPTVTLKVYYGGVTLFNDVTGTATAGAARKPWFMDFNLAAQGNADQYFGGTFIIPAMAALTAPTSGRGDMAPATALDNAIGGDGTADSDAADRVFEVGITMSVSNAANELVTAGYTLELI